MIFVCISFEIILAVLLCVCVMFLIRYSTLKKQPPVSHKSCVFVQIHACVLSIQACVCVFLYIPEITCPQLSKSACWENSIKHNPLLSHSDRSRSPPCPASCFHHPGSRSANPISGKASASSNHKADASSLSTVPPPVAHRALHVFLLALPRLFSSMLHSSRSYFYFTPCSSRSCRSRRCLPSAILLSL